MYTIMHKCIPGFYRYTIKSMESLLNLAAEINVKAWTRADGQNQSEI